MTHDLGSDAINYCEEDFADAIRTRTSGHGVDIILDKQSQWIRSIFVLN